MINGEQNQAYVTIKAATKVTGLSECYLRKRCQERSVPVLKIGNRYMLRIDSLLQQLEDEAHDNMEA